MLKYFLELVLSLKPFLLEGFVYMGEYVQL